MTARQISTANRAENGDARHGGRSDTDRALTQSRPIAVLVDREGLGDALLKLPLLRAIARGFPRHPIWWISTHHTDMAGPLRRFMPPQLALVQERAELGKPLRAAARRLREYPEFSLVFDTRSRIANVWLARHILAHERFFCCLPGYLLASARPPGRFTRPRHIGERALSLAQAALGEKADPSGELEASAGARDVAQAVLPDGPIYVGLGIGSREMRKNWPIEKFAELSCALSGQGVAPVLLLGPREVERADEIRAAVPALASVDLTRSSAGSGSFDFTVAIAKRLSVVVANDSGTGHLFGAAGRPIVSLFGPTDPRRWAPFAPVQKTVWAREFGGEAMECIPPDAVLAAVEKILARARSLAAQSR
jgi:ADP-heptose:LPS heptosyltransferase